MTVRDILLKRRQMLVLVLMLEFLHLSIWFDFGSPYSRSFMLVHLGLFLIWQPVWRGDQKLAWYNGFLFIALTLALVTWMNRWLLAGWIILLTGFCGGRIGMHAGERGINMLTLVYLTLQLLIPATAMLFNVQLQPGVMNLFAWFTALLPIFILLFPPTEASRLTRAVDLIHAVAASTLVTLLAAGTLLNMYRGGNEYLFSLVQTLLVMGIFLLAISWLLTPRLGFSGLSQLWSRAITNIGSPFEQWLGDLAELFRRFTSPDGFLEAAMEDLIALDWISGVSWHSPHSEGETGTRTRYASEFSHENLQIRVYTTGPVGGTLLIHCRLLVRLIGHFYIAKQQEQELRRKTHLHAIYETGARVTHDIKNLLQSLQAITSIVVSDEQSGGSVSQQLLRRQLPHLSQRLQLALDKLQAPAAADTEMVYLKDWWNDVRQRNNVAGVSFHSEISGDPLIPCDLFESVVENLLENLREKRQAQPDLEISATVFADGVTVQLMVCDTGSHIPEERARTLFREPVESHSGLGIGLYQAGKQAESLGYTLGLEINRDGRVCFQLRGSLAPLSEESRAAG